MAEMETLKAPEEDVRPEDIVEAEVFPDDDMDDDDVLPEEDADLEDHVEAEAAETTVVPTTFTHSPELVEKATNALFSTEEIAGMSPEVLRIAILGANRVGQAVYEANRKPDETKKPTEEIADDELAVLDDPNLYNQDVVKPIKSFVTKLAARLEKVEKENEVLRSKTGNSEAQALHSRLITIATEVAPEVAKKFDVSTQTGKAEYAKLLTIMQGIHVADKSLTEPQIFQSAIRAMNLMPDKPKENPETARRKREWDEAATSTPAPARKKGETAVEAVGKILEARRQADRNRRAADKQERTNGQKPR